MTDKDRIPQPSIFNDGMAQGWLIGSWGGWILGIAGAILLGDISVISTSTMATVLGSASGLSLLTAAAGAAGMGYYRQQQTKKDIAEGRHQKTASLATQAVRGLFIGDLVASIPDVLAVIGLGANIPGLAIGGSIAGVVLGGGLAGYNMWQADKANRHELSTLQAENRELKQELGRARSKELQTNITPEDMAQLNDRLAERDHERISFKERYLAEKESATSRQLS